MVEKIKNDYSGYRDKVAPAVFALEKDLRARIKQYPDSAFFYFKRYTSFFADKHLRIAYFSGLQSDPPQLSTVSTYGETISINKDALMDKNKNPHSLEGVWVNTRGSVAIIKKEGRQGEYLVVSIDFNEVDAGQVLYELNSTDSCSFAVKEHSMYTNTLPILGKASLQHFSRQILEIHGTNIYFVRKSDSLISDKALLHTYMPKYPNGTNAYSMAIPLDDSTFFMRIPSFGRDMKDYITEIVSKHWNTITSMPNLIVDIRTNKGGQSNVYGALEPLFYTHPYEHKGVAWYASPGNINDFEEGLRMNEIEEDWIEWTTALVNEMKKHKGEFVVHPHQKASEIIKRDTIYPYPRNIGIIISELNASAAEQFILFAKNSKKVLLFGAESTAGVLDYSNVVLYPFPSGPFYLNVPKTKSLRLPDNPIDNVGIKPDVFIPIPASSIHSYDRFDDWVYFVRNYLDQLND